MTWVQVATADEVPTGVVVARKGLDTELVLWRDDAGRITCQEAWCPHAGASVAGGRLVDGCIECPFHGWRFDARGTYRGWSLAARGRLRTFPVREVDGAVEAWDDPWHGPPDQPA